MNRKILVAFSLGVMAAEHVHGVTRRGNQVLTDAIFRVLEQVASGELTLLDAPEETVAGLPPPPPELAAKAPDAVSFLLEQWAARMPELTRQAMRDQRAVAAELLAAMK